MPDEQAPALPSASPAAGVAIDSASGSAIDSPIHSPIHSPTDSPTDSPIDGAVHADTAPANDDAAAEASRATHRLPPRPELAATPDEAAARRRAREARDAHVRGVESMHAMRDAIKEAARALPGIDAVPRVRVQDVAGFRARARAGLPFVIGGLVARWPLAGLTRAQLRERFGDAPVRARVGDYIGTAFAPDRAMRDMLLRDYLDLVPDPADGLPPYVGNLELRALNALCHWPAYFDKMGPPRFWLGPAGTVTPLHCDYDDNIFAQVRGRKRIMLAPPHHDRFLYVREANPVLFGSPVDAEAPDFERYPLARQATLIECVVEPGELLFVPAGWYHQVRALDFSLSVNRWARGVPLALQGDS